MAYTLFTFPTLSFDTGDQAISQGIYYPYNATCLYDGGAANGAECTHGTSYWYFPTSGASQGQQTWGAADRSRPATTSGSPRSSRRCRSPARRSSSRPCRRPAT